MERNYICCFTGHRDIPDKHMLNLPSALDRVLEEQYQKGARIFRAGGALGFDTIAALKVIRLRQRHPDVRLELILPCRDQAAKWGSYSRSLYDRILEFSDSIKYAHESYVSGCMLTRNRMLVDGSDVCIAYYAGGGGGTSYTVSYALKNGLKIVNLFDMLK